MDFWTKECCFADKVKEKFFRPDDEYAAAEITELATGKKPKICKPTVVIAELKDKWQDTELDKKRNAKVQTTESLVRLATVEKEIDTVDLAEIAEEVEEPIVEVEEAIEETVEDEPEDICEDMKQVSEVKGLNAIQALQTSNLGDAILTFILSIFHSILPERADTPVRQVIVPVVRIEDDEEEEKENEGNELIEDQEEEDIFLDAGYIDDGEPALFDKIQEALESQETPDESKDIEEKEDIELVPKTTEVLAPAVEEDASELQETINYDIKNASENFKPALDPKGAVDEEEKKTEVKDDEKVSETPEATPDTQIPEAIGDTSETPEDSSTPKENDTNISFFTKAFLDNPADVLLSINRVRRRMLKTKSTPINYQEYQLNKNTKIMDSVSDTVSDTIKNNAPVNKGITYSGKENADSTSIDLVHASDNYLHENMSDINYVSYNLLKSSSVEKSEDACSRQSFQSCFSNKLFRDSEAVDIWLCRLLNYERLSENSVNTQGNKNKVENCPIPSKKKKSIKILHKRNSPDFLNLSSTSLSQSSSSCTTEISKSKESSCGSNHSTTEISKSKESSCGSNHSMPQTLPNETISTTNDTTKCIENLLSSIITEIVIQNLNAFTLTPLPNSLLRNRNENNVSSNESITNLISSSHLPNDRILINYHGRKKILHNTKKEKPNYYKF